MDATAQRLSLAHGGGDPDWFYKQSREVQTRLIGFEIAESRRRKKRSPAPPVGGGGGKSAAERALAAKVSEFMGGDDTTFKWVTRQK